MSRERSAEFARLLEFLKAHRGFDFTGYKIAALMRRVDKRMAEVGVEDYAAYTDYLEVHPDEFHPLFNTILINVTGFFRDPEAWEYLAAEAVPRIVEARAPDQPIRVWSAGCASGQEAYSAAMLLAEALGEDGFRERVKIYGTDVDEEALAAARSGAYAEREMDGVSPARRERFFPRARGRHEFHPDLRRALVFGRNDLTQDAAISRVDLLLCRNTLMYFNAETQDRIVARFHFALGGGGYLVLGRAESLLTRRGSFRAVDPKRRVFQRVPGTSPRERRVPVQAVSQLAAAEENAPGFRLRESAFDQGPFPQLVVDPKGYLVQASDETRRLFNLSPADLGRLLQDLEVAYRPFELRAAIDQALAQGAVVRLPHVHWTSPRGDALELDVQVMPLLGDDGAVLGTAVCFTDLTQARQLEQELERLNQDLETASGELQTANEELQTTNEQLQSTVEELETTNEELQSANEELETMNEELQSTNEELQTMNAQLHGRADELHDANLFMESILGSLNAAVVVLDERLRVEVWSPRAADLWGLRYDEVQGETFFGLDIGIGVDGLAGAVQDALEGAPMRRVLNLEAVNRRGRPIWCQVTCLPLAAGATGPGKRVLLLMEESARAEPHRSGGST